ncbi:MAG: hypothetical protein ACOCP8_05370 [archaeon]
MDIVLIVMSLSIVSVSAVLLGLTKPTPKSIPDDIDLELLKESKNGKEIKGYPNRKIQKHLSLGYLKAGLNGKGNGELKISKQGKKILNNYK